MVNTLQYYNENAERLFESYQSLDPERLHSIWKKHLPDVPGLALDVGAGSGRDSAWLAGKGWRVIAVEPAAALLEYGREATRAMAVTWIDDRLPELSRLESYRYRFGVILVGGVLMHLSPKQRAESMRTLAALMSRKALLVVTLRQGPDSEGRLFFPVSSYELAESARKESLQIAAAEITEDRLKRAGVEWETVVIKKDENLTES